MPVSMAQVLYDSARSRRPMPRPIMATPGRPVSPAADPAMAEAMPIGTDPMAGALAAGGAKERPIVEIGGPQNPELANALIQAGYSGDNNSGWEALGNLAQVWSGTKVKGDFEKADKARKDAEKTAEKDRLAAMAEALAGSAPTPVAHQARELIRQGYVKEGVELLTREAKAPNIETFYGPDGREQPGIYDPNAPGGFRPVGSAKAPSSAERKIVKGQDGFDYYTDTKERVLPDDQAPKSPMVRPMDDAEKEAYGLSGSWGWDTEKNAPVKLQEPEKITPHSDPAKAKADLDAGLITPEQYEAAVSPAGAANPATVANITSMRKEYEASPGTSRYRTAAPILSSMISSIDDNKAMSDLDFIYGMAKIFDPDSVVRESEMGLVIQGQSVPAQIVGLFSKVANGEAVLQPESRRDLVNASLNRVGEYRKQAEGEAASFSNIASQFSIKPELVVRPLEDMPSLPEQPAVAPAAAEGGPAPTIPKITSDQEYDALPPGTVFIDPEGNQRTKP